MLPKILSRPAVVLCGIAAVCVSVAGVSGAAPTAAHPPAALATTAISTQGGALSGHLSGPAATPAPSSSPTAAPSAAPALTPATAATTAATAAPEVHRKPPVIRRVVSSGGGGTGPSLGMFEDLQYLTGTALADRLNQYQALGVKVARFQVIWGNVQSGGPSSYDWTYIDAVVAGLVARGIQPLPEIVTTPAWARPAGCTGSLVCAPANPAQYGAFAGAAAAHYASMGVHSWELWNEPNNPIFWQPAPNPTLYTAMLKAAYTDIHSADPSATVITGGLAPAADGGGWIAPVEFLGDIYANGGQGSFDAVGWHPYDYPAMPSTNPGDAWNQMSTTAVSARSLMVAHGDGAKRIWATEFGAPSCTGDGTCVSEAQQALVISQGYALWRSYSWAGPMIVYSYQDIGTNQSNREDYFGLVRADGSQKPAYATYLGLATGR